MDRTQSIMRIASTASPSSGSSVRRQMEVLRMFHILNRAVHTIAAAWSRYKGRKIQKLEKSVSDLNTLLSQSNHELQSAKNELKMSNLSQSTHELQRAKNELSTSNHERLSRNQSFKL